MVLNEKLGSQRHYSFSLLQFWPTWPAVYMICGLLSSCAFLLSVKNREEEEEGCVQIWLCRGKNTAGTRDAAL